MEKLAGKSFWELQGVDIEVQHRAGFGTFVGHFSQEMDIHWTQPDRGSNECILHVQSHALGGSRDSSKREPTRLYIQCTHGGSKMEYIHICIASRGPDSLRGAFKGTAGGGGGGQAGRGLQFQEMASHPGHPGSGPSSGSSRPPSPRTRPRCQGGSAKGYPLALRQRSLPGSELGAGLIESVSGAGA